MQVLDFRVYFLLSSLSGQSIHVQKNSYLLKMLPERLPFHTILRPPSPLPPESAPFVPHPQNRPKNLPSLWQKAKGPLPTSVPANTPSLLPCRDKSGSPFLLPIFPSSSSRKKPTFFHKGTDFAVSAPPLYIHNLSRHIWTQTVPQHPGILPPYALGSVCTFG